LGLFKDLVFRRDVLNSLREGFWPIRIGLGLELQLKVLGIFTNTFNGGFELASVDTLF